MKNVLYNYIFNKGKEVEKMENNKNLKRQAVIGIILIIAMVFLSGNLAARSQDLKLFLITGLALGYILSRSRYGFAGGVKRIYMTGEGSLSRALLVMFLISIIGAAGSHYGAFSKGAVAAFEAAEGDMVIPGTGFVAPAGISTIIGGFLFGIGMMLGGGCASGTLTDSGEGSARAWIATVFFAVGGMLGHALLPWWNTKGPGKSAGVVVYLPQKFGYFGAVLISLIGLLILFAIVQAYEAKRRKAGTAVDEVYEGSEKQLDIDKVNSLFSKEAYHKLFVERWSFLTGGVLIAMMFIFIMNTTGSSWGASGPYTFWGVWALDKIGMAPKGEAFTGVVEIARNGLMNHPVHVRNIGIILGSTIAMLLAGRFKFDFNFKFKDAALYALGGILMGVGAKIGGGCNVGALYSGIANFSLSGWVFLVALVFGGIVGLKLFEGKVDIIPNRNLGNK